MEILTSGLHMLQVVLGIGLVIFVHESGHFIAARLCKVRVDVFSLGFGPRLFGWKRGHTLFQVALIPIGGYVKMAGEEPPGYRDEAYPPQDWELAGKSPMQRFFIYSGGVIMNVIFALVVFPLVLLAGVPSIEPIVGASAPGSPAWHARIDEGTRIEEVNGRELYDFNYLFQEVVLSGNEPTVLLIQRPGSDHTELIEVQSKYNEARGFHWLGLPPGRNRENRLTVYGDAAKNAGILADDILLGVEGQCDLLSPLDQLRISQATEKPIDVRIERDGQEIVINLEPETLEKGGRKLLGIAPAFDTVVDLRSGNQVLTALGLQKGDRLSLVQGKAIHSSSQLLNALLDAADTQAELNFKIDRDGTSHELGAGLRIDRVGALAIYEDIFLNPGTGGWSARVSGGSAADKAGMRSGDVVTSMDGTLITTHKQFLTLAHAATKAGRQVDLVVDRTDSAEPIPISITPALMFRVDYGIDIEYGEYIYKTDSFQEAISTGVYSAWRFLTDAWINLRKMSSGEVSSENLGGIITISVISHDFATKGLAKLFFFLCMLSVNLALLNVLPIPVLDGGHLFFILVEMIKGSPVSERTLGYSQIVGLVLIVTLMVYVTYNDLMRWIF